MHCASHGKGLIFSQKNLFEPHSNFIYFVFDQVLLDVSYINLQPQDDIYLVCRNLIQRISCIVRGDNHRQYSGLLYIPQKYQGLFSSSTLVVQLNILNLFSFSHYVLELLWSQNKVQSTPNSFCIYSFNQYLLFLEVISYFFNSKVRYPL